MLIILSENIFRLLWVLFCGFLILFTSKPNLYAQQIEAGVALEGLKFFGSSNSAFQFGPNVHLGFGMFNRIYLQGEASFFGCQEMKSELPVTYFHKYRAKDQNDELTFNTQTTTNRFGGYLKYIIAPKSEKRKNQIYILAGVDFLQVNFKYLKPPVDLSDSLAIAISYLRPQPGYKFDGKINRVALTGGAGFEYFLINRLSAFGELRASAPLSKSEYFEGIDIVASIRLLVGMRFNIDFKKAE